MQENMQKSFYSHHENMHIFCYKGCVSNIPRLLEKMHEDSFLILLLKKWPTDVFIKPKQRRHQDNKKHNERINTVKLTYN